MLSLVFSEAGSGDSYKVGINQRMVKQEPEQCQGEGKSSLGVLSSHPGKDSLHHHWDIREEVS